MPRKPISSFGVQVTTWVHFRGILIGFSESPNPEPAATANRSVEGYQSIYRSEHFFPGPPSRCRNEFTLNLPATLFRGLGRVAGLGRGHPGELISGCPDRGSSAARARRARGPVVIGCRREEAGLSFREISEIEVRTRRSNGPDGSVRGSAGRSRRL